MAARNRWALHVIGAIAYTALLLPAGTLLLALLMVPPWGQEGPWGWLRGAGELLGEEAYWAWGLLACAVLAASQLAFLVPVVRLRPPQGERPRSLAVSFAVGGLVAAALTAALALGVVELAAGLAAGDLAADPWRGEELMGQAWAGPGLLVTLAASWVLWTGLLLVFSRQLWADTVVGRLVAALFGGTVVELLVVLPVDIMVRRRTDCYCGTGTFVSLCISAVAVMWLAGPGIVLAVTARRRRLVRETHCRWCGHARGPSPGPVCPECGGAW